MIFGECDFRTVREGLTLRYRGRSFPMAMCQMIASHSHPGSFQITRVSGAIFDKCAESTILASKSWAEYMIWIIFHKMGVEGTRFRQLWETQLEKSTSVAG